MNIKDALNQELVIGKSYGYSLDRNGICDIVIGRFLNISDGGYAVLEVLDRRSAVGLHTPRKEPFGKKVSVKPIKLFPV